MNSKLSGTIDWPDWFDIWKLYGLITLSSLKSTTRGIMQQKALRVLKPKRLLLQHYPNTSYTALYNNYARKVFETGILLLHFF